MSTNDLKDKSNSLREFEDGKSKKGSGSILKKIMNKITTTGTNKRDSMANLEEINIKEETNKRHNSQPDFVISDGIKKSGTNKRVLETAH